MFKFKNLKYKLFITLIVFIFAFILYISPLSCPFLSLTGIPCLGCGMTRALISVLRLDFKSAFSYHFMFWSIPILYLAFLRDGKLFENRLLNILFYIFILIGFLINWIVRILM